MSEFDIDEKARELNLDFDYSLGGRRDEKRDEKKDAPEKKKYDYSKFKKSAYTADQIEKLLDGYDEVPAEARYSIPKGSHIRYQLVSDEFRPGGYVQNAYQLKGKPTLHLENSKDPKDAKYAKWPVVLEDVKVMWKKRTSEDARVQEVRAHSTQMAAESFERNQQIEMRLAALEAKLEKIIQFLGRKFGTAKPAAPTSARDTNTGTKVKRNL